MSLKKKKNIVFLSTYPPRECGLATFTQDLINELDKIPLFDKPKVIAVSDRQYNYDSSRVIAELQQYDLQSYIDLAEWLNESDIDLLVIEHEYGIFGGEQGEYITELASRLEVPFITTFHTVLPEPNDKQKEILKYLGTKSVKVVTMARNTVKILKSVYGIEESKIEVIHHGVPVKIVESREALKKKLGLEGKEVISTFGLISPGKGIEYAIEAIAKVAKDFKNVLYLIIGQTHPCIKREHGEVYRQKLMNMVEELGIRDNVRFINKYLTQDEIIRYLQVSDIYMTPYLNKDQAVSGTLAYAVGHGKAIVSTPYLYAQEMLSDGRGMLANFKDPDSLADCIRAILSSPEKKRRMEYETRKLGRSMTWASVAKSYASSFMKAINAHQYYAKQIG